MRFAQPLFVCIFTVLSENIAEKPKNPIVHMYDA